MISRFPPRFHFFLLSVKEVLTGGYKKVSYSQNGEDLLLVSKIFRKKKKGFYVDIGASHPLRGSNTHLFYKKGWKGINIEPHPKMRFLFNLFRPRDINLTVGIADREGFLDYFMFTEIGVNTFDRNQAIKKEKKVPLLKKTKIPVYPLKTILNKYNVSHIDLLNIDTEGFDLRVLQSNDWLRWKPTVIIVEDHLFNCSQINENLICNFLIDKGYKIHAFTGKNIIFVNKN